MPHSGLASLHGQLCLILFQPLEDRFPSFDGQPAVFPFPSGTSFLNDQFRRMKSAVKLSWCISACLPEPVPVPFLPQRFLGGGKQECILTAGIIPGGRVFSCQGSAEEKCLFLPLTSNKRHPRKAPRRNFLIFSTKRRKPNKKSPVCMNAFLHHTQRA